MGTDGGAGGKAGTGWHGSLGLFPKQVQPRGQGQRRPGPGSAAPRFTLRHDEAGPGSKQADGEEEQGHYHLDEREPRR